MRPSRSITIKDSIIIGGRNIESTGDADTTEFKSDMEEANQGLELLHKLKKMRIEEKAGYQQIENEAKMAEAKIELMRIEAQNTGERRD
ncbi:hypothetical protein MSKOL_1601 [Methanosarcina sp. Kolksee]|uniref:hypothetical protein n=1 Tax=Methanosarcina sp. Kolksee TaxID=1434099 RepID=UPI0006155F6D|nr:hypothetical protein [Methanosarcina sp. Kolksee]AKB47378.1 hypothetical protein MSKOL_1601 [Methanosarcina sp. Kolksee]